MISSTYMYIYIISRRWWATRRTHLPYMPLHLVKGETRRKIKERGEWIHSILYIFVPFIIRGSLKNNSLELYFITIEKRGSTNMLGILVWRIRIDATNQLRVLVCSLVIHMSRRFEETPFGAMILCEAVRGLLYFKVLFWSKQYKSCQRKHYASCCYSWSSRTYCRALSPRYCWARPYVIVGLNCVSGC